MTIISDHSSLQLDVTFETSIPVTSKKSDVAVVLFPSEEEERVIEWLESGAGYEEDGFEESGALFYAPLSKGTEGFVTLQRTTIHDDYPRVILTFEPFVAARDLLTHLHQTAKKFRS